MSYKSQPQNWFTPIKPIENTILKQNEKLSMVMHFEIENTLNNENGHIIFATIEKNNKIIARNIILHENHTLDLCEGHAHDLAEYPIENKNNLIKELREQALKIASMFANDPFGITKIDKNKSIFYIQGKENYTNENLLQNLMKDTDPRGITAKNVIIKTFGLNQSNTNHLNHNCTTTHPETNKELNNDITIENLINESKEHNKPNDLEKALKEQELIKKFGKSRIEKLAKQINYEGITINKNKTKTNV